MNQDETLRMLIGEIRELKLANIKIQEMLLEMQKSMGELKTDSSRMNRHISLVESVYSSVRSPLDWLRRRFVLLTGVENVELPCRREIEDGARNEKLHEHVASLPDTISQSEDSSVIS